MVKGSRKLFPSTKSTFCKIRIPADSKKVIGLFIGLLGGASMFKKKDSSKRMSWHRRASIPSRSLGDGSPYKKIRRTMRMTRMGALLLSVALTKKRLGSYHTHVLTSLW